MHGSRSHLVGLAIPDNFPEEAIQWLDYDDDTEEPASTPSLAVEHADDAMSGTSASTRSATMTIQLPGDEFVDRGKHLPSRRDLRSWDQIRRQPWRESDRKLTMDFYRCLGYHLGWTLRQLREEHEADLELLKCPKRRRDNWNVLARSLSIWQADYHTRQHGEGNDAIPQHRDLVKIAEPGRLWDGGDRFAGDEEAATDLVRKGIIKEAYENKTLLWPRRCGFDEDENDENIVKIPHWCRESTWALAHPSVRPKAKQFFNMNHWPLHLQTEKRQAEIRESGLAEPTPEEPGKTDSDGPPKSEEEIRYPYVVKLHYVRTFGDKFWSGDTPRQQKAAINALRRSK